MMSYKLYVRQSIEFDVTDNTRSLMNLYTMYIDIMGTFVQYYVV